VCRKFRPQRQRWFPRHPRPAQQRLRTFRTGNKRWWPGSIGSNGYPAQAHGAEGVASLAFTIDRKGNVLNSQIATTSGSAVLDAEVLALVKRAAPFPPPPAVVVDADLSFVVPIRFTAGERR
jgi:TonB family protein